MDVNYGADTSFTIIPDSNAHLDSLLVDGSLVDSTVSYIFYYITNYHAIHAKFLSDIYTITVIQTEHGTITPGTTDVPHGESTPAR